MKTTRVVLFLTVLAILWCADVFAHNCSGVVAHFDPCTANDPSSSTDCADNDGNSTNYTGGHGHIHEYEELNGTPGFQHDGVDDVTQWGYWTAGGYAATGGQDCDDSTTPPPTFSIVVISGPGSGAPGSQLTFVVEVRRDGTAASGQTVDFSITSGDGNASLNPTSPTTGNNGRAQTILTLDNSASGSYSITATSNSQSVSATATVQTSPPPPPPPPPPSTFSINVVTSPGSGEPGDTLTFAVEVQQDGTLTQGLTVDFSITSGDGNASLGSASETTGSNGQAQTTLILGSSASGSYTIRATSNGVSVSRTATVQTSPPPPPPPPPPSTFSINVVSSPGSGEPGDILTFAVEVQQDGTLTQGLTVDFSITSGDGNASLGSASETTGSNGQAQTTLILGSSASGAYTIRATSNGVSVSATATVEDSQPAFSIRVVTSPGSGEPGDTLTFVVEVLQDGTLTQGLTVDFSITSGDGNASLGSASETTGSNGQAQTTLILGSSASGAYTIRATSNGVSVSGTATVQTSPPPPPPPPPEYSIRVVTSPGSGEPGDTLAFAVEVQQDGTLTQGLTVDFSITSGDENATLNTTSTTTDSNGQAQTTLTLGNSASGSYTITATSNGVSVSATATVEDSLILPTPAFSIRVVTSPGSGEPGDTLTFAVEVQQDGTLTQGLTVDFSITSGDENATLNTTSTTTDSNGQAQTTLTLGNSASGSYTITATSNGVSVSGTATVETEDDNNGNGNGNGGNNQEPDIPQRTDPESDEDRRFAFQLSLDAGWNFVHIPLEVTQVDGQSMSIETLGNLFQILMPANMYIYDGTCWMEVLGDSTQGLGTTQGVAVYMDAPKTVNLVGTPLPTSFTLERGMNFVGLPRQSTDLQKVSDFLAFYPKVCAILVAVDGGLYLVGRAGDSGDVEITGGQAFGIISVEQYMTSFGGAAWGKMFVE